MLTAVTYLRTLYMNLDVTDDPYIVSWRTDDPEDSLWPDRRDERGKEILGVLQHGRYFEYVALLLHSRYGGNWAMYYPPWRQGRKIVYESPHTM